MSTAPEHHPLRIQNLSTALTRGEHGVFFSSAAGPVSYAPEGHADCFQVEDRSFWFQHRNNCIAGMVANHPYSGLMLDVGGGNGYVAQRLISEGREVMLLEPGPTGARNARVERGLPYVACATVENAGFLPASFGAVGLFDVIEHIEQDRGFLSRLAPLLVPGGRLYLTVPCHQWLWSQADVHAGHFRRHTQASMAKLLDGLFAIDYFSYFFRPLVGPQYLLRALPHRLGIGRGQQLMSKETEHGSGNGAAVRALGRLLESEARTIAAGGSLGFGASALVTARRV